MKYHNADLLSPPPDRPAAPRSTTGLPLTYEVEDSPYEPREGERPNPVAEVEAGPRVTARAPEGRRYKEYQREFSSGVTGNPVGLLYDSVLVVAGDSGSMRTPTIYVENCSCVTINAEPTGGALSAGDVFQVIEVLDDDTDHVIYQGDLAGTGSVINGFPLSITLGPSVHGGGQEGGVDSITATLKAFIAIAMPKRIAFNIDVNQVSSVRIWVRGSP